MPWLIPISAAISPNVYHSFAIAVPTFPTSFLFSLRTRPTNYYDVRFLTKQVPDRVLLRREASTRTLVF